MDAFELALVVVISQAVGGGRLKVHDRLILHGFSPRKQVRLSALLRNEPGQLLKRWPRLLHRLPDTA